jgi:DNA-directed RNA polymerase subunit RPC12/RpoP
MAEVQSVKCPNCGGSVRGAGAVTCPYCGSSLEVKSDVEQKREVKRAFGAVGVDVGVEPPFIFQNLPGVEITRQTKDIPFQPSVIYSRLPGGEPAGPLRDEADAILEVVRRTQEAINREDMAAYMSCITETHKKFRAQAQQGANAQFVTTDMKRYTVAADFRKLTANKAEVVVTVEVFIFFDSGKVNHLQVPFYWKMRKERGRWVVYGSGVSGAGGGGKIWILVVSIVLPIVIGIVAAIIGGVSECRDDTEAAPPDQGEGDVWKAESRKKPMPDKWFRARGDLTLYESPTDDPDVEAVLKAGGEFKLLGYYDGWFHVSTRNNTWGWVPEDVMKKHLGSEFNDIPR